MSNTFQAFVNNLVHGFKDSFLGIFALYNFYLESKKQKPHSTEKREPLTALARRRAERLNKTQDAPQKEPNVIHRLALCSAWNGGVFLMSILLFNNVLIPTLQYIVYFIFGGSDNQNFVWHFIGSVVHWTFNALWILPLFILSKFVNCFWFQDIADAAYRKSRGRPLMLPSLGKVIADILFSVILQIFFLIQGMLASLLPIPAIGYLVSLLHMSLLYSLYAFEYKWFNMGWEVNKRLHHIEKHWPYFVGFGLPLSVLTSMPESYFISGAVFSILFPLFIISGNQADIQPPPFEIPLKVFSVVIAMTNAVFQISVKKSTMSASIKTDQVETQSGSSQAKQSRTPGSSKHVRLKEM